MSDPRDCDHDRAAWDSSKADYYCPACGLTGRQSACLHRANYPLKAPMPCNCDQSKALQLARDAALEQVKQMKTLLTQAAVAILEVNTAGVCCKSSKGDARVGVTRMFLGRDC